MYNEGMITKRISEKRIVVSSADNQFYVIIDHQGFRRWRTSFFHDSNDLPIGRKIAYNSGLALWYAKKFIEENTCSA